MTDQINDGHHSSTGSTERGSVLVIGLFLAVVAIGLTVSTLTHIAANSRQSKTDFALNGQAVQMARAGITEATNWFRRQPIQPVSDFSPTLDLAADPAVADTDDPDMGLVRDFRIEGNLWGRYEVWREWDDDPDQMRAERRLQMQARDVSDARGDRVDGASWRLRSVGYLYQRNDSNAAFDELPNRVQASAALESEIRRLSIKLPGASALNIGDGNRATINTYGCVIGGADGAGITYPEGSGRPNMGPSNQRRVTGTPSLSPVPDYEDSLDAVFGLSIEELEGIADFVVTRDGDFPVPLPNNSIVVIKSPSFHFTAATPLLGSGLVVVSGNAVLSQGSLSSFSGILYVDGNLQVRQPAEIRGSAIVTGTCTVQGSKDKATLLYDEEAVRSVQLSLSQYRLSGPVRSLYGGRWARTLETGMAVPLR